MSRFRSASADKVFSSVIFLAFFLSFFIISLSADQVTPIQLGQIQLSQLQLSRAYFKQVSSGQAQFRKNQTEQLKSDQTPSQQAQSQQTQTEQAQAQQAQQPSPGPKQAHFYNVDSERRIEGTIQEIILEPRYEERQPFLMIVIKEKKTGEIYKVEVSPAWFFNYDLHKGESIKIIGSFYSLNNENFLIAREVQVGGETFRVRDSRGFPHWRGGPMKGKVRRIRGK